MQYLAIPTKNFLKKVKKLITKNQKLAKIIKSKILLLQENPFEPILHSHKITRKKSVEEFSISATEDIRIIWRYGNVDGEIEIIQILELLDIGGHNEVY